MGFDSDEGFNEENDMVDTDVEIGFPLQKTLEIERYSC